MLDWDDRMLRKEQRLETHLLAFARDGRGVGSLFVSEGQNADFHGRLYFAVFVPRLFRPGYSVRLTHLPRQRESAAATY